MSVGKTKIPAYYCNVTVKCMVLELLSVKFLLAVKEKNKCITNKIREKWVLGKLGLRV